MQEATLIKMLNRIGDFFIAMPDREEAMHGIADHVRQFWELRMRQQLAGLLEDPFHAAEINPIILEALERFEWK